MEDIVIASVIQNQGVRYLAAILLFLPLTACFAQSAMPGSVLTFYITDGNLVTDHRGVMTISTAGLVDFTINGTPIGGPSDMVETGIDTGMFQLQLELPSSINGRPLQDGDVVEMTYHQPADYSGHPQTITQSVVLRSVPTIPSEPAAPGANIGQYYTIHLYAPNYNLDSQVPDDIPLSAVEVHMGGVSTTLADSAFVIGTGVLRETGPDTGVFSATFKIPREIDGFPVEIGSSIEFRVADNSQPIPSSSSIFLNIGTHYQANAPQAPARVVTRNISVQSYDSNGANVNFANSTSLDGLSGAVCYPSSGSYFPVGTTTVTCSGTNPEGTSVLRSFSVTVAYASHVPRWVRSLASLWCQNSIGQDDFAGSVKFLAASKIVTVPNDSSGAQVVDKQAICAWSSGNLADYQAVRLFTPLVR